MTSSITDSRLFAPLFHSEAMQALFSDEARVEAMLKAEAALARAQAWLGIIPGGAAETIDRATGPWHAEWIGLPKAFVLAHCAVSRAVFLLKGLEVFPVQMQKNLDLSQGLIVAESAMMALAKFMGRQEAHDIVYAACREAQSRGASLHAVLSEDPQVTRHLDDQQLETVLSPGSYLGQAQQLVDRMTDP